MRVTKTQVFCGVGITIGLLTICGAVHFCRRAHGTAPSAVQANLTTWLRPVSAKISSKFGYRINPVTKVRQFHNGVDLPVSVNTKVKNPSDGTVLDVYSNKEGGNQLLIKHINGFVSGYAHLNKVLVKKGDKIKKGADIALSGNTGISTGPHVHLTLKDTAGKYLDANMLLYA